MLAAEVLSTVSNLSSALPAMGAERKLEKAVCTLAEDLKERDRLDLSETLIDGSFSPAKKGTLGSGNPSEGRICKLMAIINDDSLPVALCAGSASPREVTLLETALKARFVKAVPRRMIGDKTYDSDTLDKRLKTKPWI